MTKTGTIISMPITKRNGVQIATVEYDSPEGDLCSIKSTDTRSNCAGCGGCHTCGRTQNEGLLVVQGNIVAAVNVSGKDICKGKKVKVFISDKAAHLQGLFALGIPLFLSSLFFTLIFMQTHSEALAFAGIAGGLVAGAGIACAISRSAKEQALPQIVHVYA